MRNGGVVDSRRGRTSPPDPDRVSDCIEAAAPFRVTKFKGASKFGKKNTLRAILQANRGLEV